MAKPEGMKTEVTLDEGRLRYILDDDGVRIEQKGAALGDVFVVTLTWKEVDALMVSRRGRTKAIDSLTREG